jgi:hypothetical protein
MDDGGAEEVLSKSAPSHVEIAVTAKNLLVRILVPGALGAVLLATSADAATQTLVEQRVVTQEGLAIALASTVLQSQLEILVDSLIGTKGSCTALVGKAGSIKLLSFHKVSKKEYKTTLAVYFDTKCKSLYITANPDITQKGDVINVVETADYSSPTGFKLGTMAINENAILDNSNVKGVSGLGQFRASGSKAIVDLGLTCKFSDFGADKEPPFPCEGGIAQDFPKLNEALASVTPLTLTLKGKQGNKGVTFSGTKSDMVTGAPGALSITTPSQFGLGIGGKSKRYGTAVTTGSAATFSLFPPKPTSWTIVDKAHDATFSIAVISNTTRESKGTVTQTSTGHTLASFKADQSGTGSITYSDHSTAKITSWLLSE